MLQIQYKTNALMRCKYRSFAIPLGGILALLLILLTMLVMPMRENSAMALESDLAKLPATDLAMMESAVTGAGPLAASATTYADNNLSLTIGGAGEQEAVKTVAGGVAYRAHTIQVSATNMKAYSVIINGPVGLKSDTNTTTISGAGNKLPSAMPENSWGFAYGQTGNPDAMTYSSFTGSNQTIDSANTTPNFTKNLVFAAKFGENASVGHYTGTVTLLVTATPKVITTYTLSYNANGGSNPPTTQTYTDDTEAGSHTFTIPNTKPTRSGYEFAGWSTTSTGSVAYQPGGSITLQVSTPSQTLYAKWNQIYNYSVTYNANGGSNAPSTQTASSTATSYSFTAANQGSMTKTGYTFLGWSESSSATTASYTAGSTKVNLTSSAPSKTLYAVWQKLTTWDDLVNMQDMTPYACSTAPSKTTKTLTDSRDGNTYTIAKLDDGRCWMTSDLKLTNRTIYSSDSDVTSSFTVPSSASSYNYFDAAYTDTPQMYFTNSTGYYNWYTITAGTGKSTTTGEATGSICPKGWTLPSSGDNSDSEYKILYEAMGQPQAAAIKVSPYNFTPTGRVTTSGYVNTDRGVWWSRSGSSSNDTSLTFGYGAFSATQVTTFVSYPKNFANTARCIARS